jgi:hypothetical protein
LERTTPSSIVSYISRHNTHSSIDTARVNIVYYYYYYYNV